MGISLPRGPIGEPGGGGDLTLGTMRDRWRRALEMECLSLWELCEGNLEGGLP